MSSKFSKQGATLMPPAVCRRPPFGPDFRLPPFEERWFQWYVDFRAPHSPYEGSLIGTSAVRPDPPNSKWFAEIANEDLEVRLQIDYTHPPAALAFQLECYYGGTLYDTFNLTDIVPRDWEKLDTGLLRPNPGPPDGRLYFRVYA